MEAETPEEVLAKQHRKEKKDLQAKIQSMKNAVPKNDKKRRKQMAEDVAGLEADLNLKHREELERLNCNAADAEKEAVEEVLNGVEALAVQGEEEEEEGEEEERESKQTRVSKAKKRREKKAAQERERERRIARAEVENLSGLRHQEGLKLTHALAQRQLQIREIQSDGHCLYRAVEDQLPESALGLKELRARTARHMRGHAHDFLPFLTNPDTGDMYTAEEFEKYCSDVEHTAAWGGQLELRALTQVLQLPIEVIQADSPAILIGEEYDKPAVTLVYMRHAYGLGEHYNSVERLKEPANEEG